MARSSRGPSRGNKNDIKTTIIFVLLLIVGLQAFFLFQQNNQPKKSTQKPVVKPVQAVSSAQVVKKPIVKPVSQQQQPIVTRPVPVTPPIKLAPGSSGKIAFIIDDWGYTTRNCRYLKEIDAPLDIAILPNLRNTNNIVKCAKANNKTVMLHLPLEPYNNKDAYPDNYLITTTMKPALVEKILVDTLNKMPDIEGVNNHMGSRATEHGPLMKLIFRHLKKRKLFFVDSMTAPKHSVCAELADQMKLPFAQRDVFLDNVNKKEDIERQIAVLAQKAKKQGYAIAIGHDRELTMQVIKEQIPILRAQGFEIVTVRDLLRNQ